ncbi:hypothetical protein I3260_02945 [Photobacterium damselae]|uniref:hypothetical protein n=1 Tax=Gammaproteobacteria TaxID=1236 RepID=UPI001EDD0DBD|nr:MULTISPECIES: hypothetical protein [Gammaproteobacteria]MCG3811192.1 hypothetical protein [Photobacterium damselae]MCG3880728.1 hypothetical protein [Psychrobacter sp. Ps6]
MELMKIYSGKAEKIKGDGFIFYDIYRANNDQLYIQLSENNIITATKGTFSRRLFMVTQDLIRKSFLDGTLVLPEGFDPLDGSWESVGNKNTSAFVKAALRDYFPEEKLK